MRQLKIALFVMALVGFAGVLGSSDNAQAGNDWTTYEGSYTYAGNAYIGDYPDGTVVSGTWTTNWTTKWRYDGSKYQYRYHAKRSFVSDDGTIKGKGVWNSNRNSKTQAAYTYTYKSKINYTQKGKGLVDTDWYKAHYTYNANGELTSYKYDWE
jgi:hypothetical protein